MLQIPPYPRSTPSFPHLLLSHFHLPSQWAHGAFGEIGGEEKRKGGTESAVQAFGCKGECTWMGSLPGHAVRGYCPACQQPLSFNGARISSFWWWQMTGTQGRRGGEHRSGSDVPEERKRVSWGERWDEGEGFGDRGLETLGPLNPPSTEILALNPSYGIVCCCGDFIPLFLWQSFFLMDSRSTHTSLFPFKWQMLSLIWGGKIALWPIFT